MQQHTIKMTIDEDGFVQLYGNVTYTDCLKMAKELLSRIDTENVEDMDMWSFEGGSKIAEKI